MRRLWKPTSRIFACHLDCFQDFLRMLKILPRRRCDHVEFPFFIIYFFHVWLHMPSSYTEWNNYVATELERYES